MLDHDPTEAIHSELIIPTLRRYFRVTSHTHAGGALAYLLLTHNTGMWELPEAEREAILRKVMAEDDRFLRAHPSLSMFDLIICQPDHAAVEAAGRSGIFREEEERRENRARLEGGLYYTRPIPVDMKIVLNQYVWPSTFFLESFHAAEPIGTWTAGSVAVMRFFTCEDRDLHLNLYCRPLGFPSFGAQRIFALVNGRHVGTYSCAADEIISIPISRGPGNSVTLTLVLPDAASPKDLGINDDNRQLAICVHQMELVGKDGATA
jgi:hypothetical protein